MNTGIKLATVFLPEDMKKPITNVDEGRAFIKGLFDGGWDFHFDDGAFDCLGDVGFSVADLHCIDTRVGELFDEKIDWGDDEDPFGYLIKLIEGERE